jgi:hypothetical protein
MNIIYPRRRDAMTMKMTKKEAVEITGGLSNTSKMPCKSYGLPAAECKTGGTLRRVANTVCSDCYACKGMYQFGNVQDAQYRRLGSIYDPDWIEAMVTLIKGSKYFRWHDSGDLQGLNHLERIFEVCRRTPGTMHWLPTKEYRLITEAQAYAAQSPSMAYLPKNLIIRVSAPNIDQSATSLKHFMHTCTVHTKFDKAKFGKECRAYTRGGHCGKCRACWDKKVKNVSYPKH